MSIATEISRLTTLRNNIRGKLISLGLINDVDADLDDCYTAMNGITAKSSSDISASGNVVTVPAGFYGVNGSKTIGTTKTAATYNTSSSNRTIAAGTYLSGAQTIRGVTTSGIDAEYILSGHNMKVGDSASAGRIKDVTGTYVPYLEFTNVSLAATDWISDSTYTDYSYKAAITCTGATADMFPFVEFSSTDIGSGVFYNAAQSYAGGVYIYASEALAITIPKITFYKRG